MTLIPCSVSERLPRTRGPDCFCGLRGQRQNQRLDSQGDMSTRKVSNPRQFPLTKAGVWRGGGGLGDVELSLEDHLAGKL